MRADTEKPRPIYFFCGDEDYLIEEEINRIKKRVLEGPFAEMNLQTFDAKNDSAADIISAAQTMPAFAEYRLIVVKSAESLKDTPGEDVAAYLNDPAKSTVLILISSAAKPDTRTNIVKLLSAKGYIEIKSKLDSGELTKRITSSAKKRGKTLTGEARIRLIAKAGDRLRDLLGELEKIMLYAGDKAEIEERDVEAAGIDCSEESVFALSDAIGDKDIKTALKVLDRLSDEEPLALLGTIARQIRTLLLIKTLERKGMKRESIAATAHVPPFHLNKYMGRAGKFSDAELINAIARLKKADTALKSGTSPDSVVLPSLVIELCSAGRPL